MTAIFQNAFLVLGGVFACVMLLFGALLVGVGLFPLRNYSVAARWPQVPAAVDSLPGESRSPAN